MWETINQTDTSADADITDHKSQLFRTLGALTAVVRDFLENA